MPRRLFLALMMIVLIVGVCAGLQARWLPWTPVAALAVCGLLVVVWRAPDDPSESLLRTLFLWGVGWLVLGLLFEPWEGGIKKDHPTLSYYFVTSGLACFSLVTLTLVGTSSVWKRPLKLLQANGRNPMVAYVGMGNFIVPVLGLTGASAVLHSFALGPWAATAVAACQTLVLAYLVALCTRKGLTWRT